MSTSLAISADSETEINFEIQILPILQNRCFSCHSAPKVDANGTITKPKGTVQLDSAKGIETSLHGEVIIAGEPEDSLALSAYHLTRRGYRYHASTGRRRALDKAGN